MPIAGSLVVAGVTRKFGMVWVLRGVNAEFAPGTITIIEGPNGGGKSTLLAIVGGILRPNSGTVFWQMDGPRSTVQRTEVGWVGHESLCYRELTAYENVELSARLHGAERSTADFCLERVGAHDFRDRRLGMLSRGQKQRVALARALVHRPRLLLLDEPFSGLDESGIERLESVLLEERTRGTTVLVVSHDRTLSSRLGAKRVYLTRGRVDASDVVPS